MPSPAIDRSQPSSRLISRSSILILGGVLIGITFSEALYGDFSAARFFAFLAAMIGLLAFLGLDELSRRRQMRSERQARQVAEARMEQRVSRHLSDDVD